MAATKPVVLITGSEGRIGSAIAGGLLIALALPRGAIVSHYGAWDRTMKAGERWSDHAPSTH